MTATAIDDGSGPSLAGSTDEALRRSLLQFGSGAGCRATGDMWNGPICGKPAPWVIACEDSVAGVTVNGAFSPAETSTVLCDEHLARLRTEPRRIFWVFKRTNPDAPHASVAIIRLPEGWS
jgi:hypothetical protein